MKKYVKIMILCFMVLFCTCCHLEGDMYNTYHSAQNETLVYRGTFGDNVMEARSVVLKQDSALLGEYALQHSVSIENGYRIEQEEMIIIDYRKDERQFFLIELLAPSFVSADFYAPFYMFAVDSKGDAYYYEGAPD